VSDDDFTPIDRPLMRSDLDGVRRAMHNLEQLAVRHYSEATATRREGRVLAIVCVACAVFSFGCAMAVIP
jgi:hypothetical protein